MASAHKLPTELAQLIARKVLERPPAAPTRRKAPGWHELDQTSATALASLRLANRKWHSVVTPIFFSHIRLSTSHHARAAQTIDGFLQHCSAHFAQVEALELELDAEPSSRIELGVSPMPPCVVRLIRSLSGVRQFVLSFCPVDDWRYDLSEFSQALLQQAWPLSRLTLRRYVDEIGGRDGFNIHTWLTSLEPSLESAELSDCMIPDSVEAILYQCTSLRALAMHDVAGEDHFDVTGLPLISPLQTFWVNYGCDLAWSDEGGKLLISLSQSLVTLEVVGGCLCWLLSAPLPPMPNLETVDFAGCWNSCESRIYACTLPSLRHICGLDRAEYFERRMTELSEVPEPTIEKDRNWRVAELAALRAHTDT